MGYREKTLWITRTAVFIALLVVLQAATAPLGNTIITGTLVNALLVVSAMGCGAMSGVTVAAISPIMAKLMGIGPLWGIIPFIALGNRDTGNRNAAEITALVAAALAKFLVLYLGIVKVAVPLLLKLPEPQASVVSGMFSVPQLITALLGGAAALPVIHAVRRVFLKR